MDKKQERSGKHSMLVWSLQILLAVTFFWAGFTKLFTPAEQLSAMWPWTRDKPLLVTVAGVADILAGIGMTLPHLLRIWPVLTLYACYGILLLMAAAIIFHWSRGEVPQTWINFAVALLTIAVILLRKNEQTG